MIEKPRLVRRSLEDELALPELNDPNSYANAAQAISRPMHERPRVPMPERPRVQLAPSPAFWRGLIWGGLLAIACWTFGFAVALMVLTWLS